MEHKALVVADNNEVEGLDSDGFGANGPDFPKIIYDYNGKCFRFSDTKEVFADTGFECMILHFKGKIRRDYEKPWNAEANADAPSCYSLDISKGGSREREHRTINGVERSIYGDCGSCWFSEFGTAGGYKDGATLGKAPQCNRYSLALVLCADGVQRMFHIPPTGVDPVGNTLQMLVNSAKPEQQPDGSFQAIRSLYNLRYKFLPSGGGKKRNAISVLPAQQLSPEGRNELRELAQDRKAGFDNYVTWFARGPQNDADVGKDSTPTEGMG